MTASAPAPGRAAPTAAGGSLRKIDSPSDSPARAVRQADDDGPQLSLGATVRRGGDTLLSCTKGLEDDTRWFARHFGRDHRIRKPLGKERASFGRPPGRGLVTLVAVRQVAVGYRVRVAVFAPRGTLNSEAAGRAAFKLAREAHPWLPEFEQAWRAMP